MNEVCYCGRVGEIEDREPIADGAGEGALRCPNDACGHLEYLRWLPDDARRHVFDEAKQRRLVRLNAAA